MYHVKHLRNQVVRFIRHYIKWIIIIIIIIHLCLHLHPGHCDLLGRAGESSAPLVTPLLSLGPLALVAPPLVCGGRVWQLLFW